MNVGPKHIPHSQESFIGAFLIKVNFLDLPQILSYALELGNAER